MALTETELRQHLEAAASQASPPRLSVPDLIGRIRRRRVRTAWTISACIAAVAAITVAVPLGLANSTRPGQGAESGPGLRAEPGPLLRPMPFTVTVNGQRPSIPPHHKPPKGCGRSTANPCPAAPEPGVIVSPGERLSIRVTVSIPARARISDLWLGISHGTFGSTGTGQPTGQQPILAHIRKHLEPGQHTFWVAWTVPAQTPHGTVLWLAASWRGMLPVAQSAWTKERLTSGSVSGPITALYVSR